MRLSKCLRIAFLASFLGSTIARADTSHYPYKDYAYADEWTGVYLSEWTGQQLGLNMSLDPSFSEEAKDLIKRSMSLFMGRFLEDQVIDCAFENASKDLKRKNKQEFTQELYQAVKWNENGELKYPGFFYIARYWGDARSVGHGYMNLFYKQDYPLVGYKNRHYFYIALNSDFLAPHSVYAFAQDENYWAGVIAHEFLHNLGWDHPTGYSGSFIKEYGNCVAADGMRADIPSGASDYSEVYEL